MLEVNGKVVYTELDEIVSPAHAALLIIDMQRDFVTTDGVFATLGGDLSVFPPMIERLRALTDVARDCEMLVVHIRHSMMPNLESESPAQMRFNLRISEQFLGLSEPLRYAVEGTQGADGIPELLPVADEVIVKKHRSSALWGTNLDVLLRSNGIEAVVITGCTTEGCIESTARDALFNDYYAVIVEDCVASDDAALHEASLLLMRHRFDVVSSQAIISSLRGTKSGSPSTAWTQ